MKLSVTKGALTQMWDPVMMMMMNQKDIQRLSMCIQKEKTKEVIANTFSDVTNMVHTLLL